MAISVLNTDAGLSGKTIVNAEDSQTVTGLKTYDRDPSAPFAVASGSAVVSNLDADKVDGMDYSSGSWTPGIAFGGATTGLTYATQAGTYHKIGRIVVAECEITLTSNGTATGAATLTGLPFTTATPVTALVDTVTGLLAIEGDAGDTTLLYLGGAASATTLSFLIGTATSRTAATEANFSDTARVRSTIVYIATA